MKKKVLIVALSLLLCMVLSNMALAAVVSSGTCGENITWTKDDVGTLVINGTGDMPDFDDSLAPWYENSVNYTVDNPTKKIVISSGITSIGNRAFLDGGHISNVDIPQTVTRIGNKAFYSCERLESIVIPSSVISIGEQSFAMSGLKSVSIPKEVNNIGNGAFYWCVMLVDVYYGGSETQWQNLIGDVKIFNVTDADFHMDGSQETDGSVKMHFNSNIVGADSKANVQQTSSNIKIMLNGSPLAFNEAPYMANGTTMVPMRVIFEALKAEVNYDAATQKITAIKGDTVIELVLGQKSAKKNGQTISLDVAATTRNGNTMVPLRFVAEALNAKVDWDNASQTVSITLAE